MTTYSTNTRLTVPLTALCLLAAMAACAPGEQAAPSPTAAMSPTAEPTGAAPTMASPTAAGPSAGVEARTIRVALRDGRASPPPDRVEVDLGQRVRIVVTSDTEDEVHVHGYDETVRLRPGEPASVEFVADQPGLYEVETHHSGTLLLQLAVSG